MVLGRRLANAAALVIVAAGLLIVFSPPRATKAQAYYFNQQPSNSICINGTVFTTQLDDEFTQDPYLKISNNSAIVATPDPTTGAIWSPLAFSFGHYDNDGIAGVQDDAMYANPSGPSGFARNPFSLNATSGLTITASPIPSPFYPIPGSSPTAYLHWSSGWLTSVSEPYGGYVEFSAKLPTVNGAWPALWLVADTQRWNPALLNSFPQWREADLVEIFGSFNSSIPQQTLIYSYQNTNIASPAPDTATSFDTRNALSSSASAADHTYGVLMSTPAPGAPYNAGYMTYYQDRVPTEIWPAIPGGQYNAIINLQMFLQNGAYYGGTNIPSFSQSYSMAVQYFRWYVNTGVGCGSQPVLPTVATPVPSPSPSANVVTIQQVSNVAVASSGFPTITFTTAPAAGHMVIFALNGLNAINCCSGGVPNGFAPLDASAGIYYCIVGATVAGSSGTCLSSTSYGLGGNGATAVGLDITGENQSYYTTNNPVVNSVRNTSSTVTSMQTQFYPAGSGGLNLLIWELQMNANASSLAVSDLPAGSVPNVGLAPAHAPQFGQALTNKVSSLNVNTNGTNYESIIIDEFATEAAQGGWPLEPLLYVSNATSNRNAYGDAFTILPTGSTPAPTPAPSLPP